MRPEAEASGYRFVAVRTRAGESKQEVQEQRPQGLVVEKIRSAWAHGDPRGPSASPQDDTPSEEGGKGNSNSNSKGNSNSNSNGKSKDNSNSNSKGNSNSQCGDSSLRSE
jgi:hypothetical protein